ncbi:MAG: glycosyltransferase [Pseudomonadota bacterium]
MTALQDRVSMQASIVIPHHDDLPRLRRCLAALMPTVPDGVEVAVVDNASPTDPGPVLAAEFPALRVLHEPRPGAAHARNRGVAGTTGEVLLFIDADCVPDADWVAQGLRLAGAADVIGGAVAVFDETPPPRSGAEAFEAVFAFDFRRYIEREGFTGAGNMVTTRTVFQAVGPFRPAVSEDKDWSQRAVAAGFSLSYAPDLRVGHPSRSDWPALQRKWRRLTDEMWALHRAEGRGRLTWAGRAALMPVSVLAHAPRILRSGRLEPGERGPALATLARLRLARMGWMLRQAVTAGQ